MRLAVARLCLDCEEVHDGDRCPVCGSETFAFLKKWVLPAALAEGSLLVQQSLRPRRTALCGPGRHRRC